MFRCRKKPRLNANHLARRLEWANLHVNENDEFWNKTVFTDEKVFQSSNSGTVKVYRPINSKFDQKFTAANERSGRFSVHVWGWISHEGKGVLHEIGGRLNGAAYTNILQEIMLPTVRLRFGDDFILQQVIMQSENSCSGKFNIKILF